MHPNAMKRQCINKNKIRHLKIVFFYSEYFEEMKVEIQSSILKNVILT